MRVALVAPFVAAIDERRSQIGGAQAVIADLARGLASRGHDVTLLAPRGSRVSGVEVVDLGIDADPRAVFGRGAEPASQREAFGAVGAWLAAHPKDAVHAHAFDAPAFDCVRGARVVHTLHLPPVDPAVVAAARAATAMLATVSESWRRAWMDAGARVDELLPNGIDLAAVPIGRGEGGYLAFAGRMSAEKDPVAACRVARTLGLPLRLAGPIYDDRYFTTEVEPQLGPDVAYVGALDRTALWALLGAASATLLPVRWDEPFGMVALESLAVGTPVVAYARGGLVDVVRDGRSGVLVAPDDEKAFADGVRRSRDLHREDCRANAARYDLARMLDAHEALYRRLS